MDISHTATIILCRAFQSVLKLVNYFMGYRMPACPEGPGKVRKLGSFLREKGLDNVLVVTGSGMVRPALRKPTEIVSATIGAKGNGAYPG